MGQELVPVSAVSLAALVPGTQRSPELGTTGRRLDIDTITLHTLHTIYFVLPSFHPQCGIVPGYYNQWLVYTVPRHILYF